MDIRTFSICPLLSPLSFVVPVVNKFSQNGTSVPKVCTTFVQSNKNNSWKTANSNSERFSRVTTLG